MSNAVRDGVVDVLNAFYLLNVQELALGNKSGVSSGLIKELSGFAGVLQRSPLAKKQVKFLSSIHGTWQLISFNGDPGNWLWKAIVELIREFLLQKSQPSSGSVVFAVPADMNSEKVGDLLEAMIGELMITYPAGMYERVYPYRAVWDLPTMTTATQTDKAVP